jgi:hypothetical protein
VSEAPASSTVSLLDVDGRVTCTMRVQQDAAGLRTVTAFDGCPELFEEEARAAVAALPLAPASVNPAAGLPTATLQFSRADARFLPANQAVLLGGGVAPVPQGVHLHAGQRLTCTVSVYVFPDGTPYDAVAEACPDELRVGTAETVLTWRFGPAQGAWLLPVFFPLEVVYENPIDDEEEP